MVQISQDDLDDDLFQSFDKTYWEKWHKAHPKPEVEYWADDEKFQRSRSSSNDSQVCPQHGVKNLRTGDFDGRGFGCRYCLLQEQLASEPKVSSRFKEERNPNGLNPYEYGIVLLAKKGFKGNAIPKNGKTYEDLLVWQHDQEKAGKQFQREVRLHSKDLMIADATTRSVVGMIQDQQLEIRPKK